ncbi:hypothetical protein LMANV2_260049 [Leptospira interrogans serovar Manilae]|uniref:Uncharacterized protein n=1 Tax=Leptospira interrogans serovar Manilae TaxID=214675 RepID=A0AAQ1NWR2_LEPIR|nr:hypothetical protein LMANV2_260049 [Leptospira interrogans serovar Manilae]
MKQSNQSILFIHPSIKICGIYYIGAGAGVRFDKNSLKVTERIRESFTRKFYNRF